MAANIYGEDVLARNTPLNTKAMADPVMSTPKPCPIANGDPTASLEPAIGLDLLAHQ